MSEILDAIGALPPTADYLLFACAIGMAVALACFAYSMRPGPDDRLPDDQPLRREWRHRLRDRRKP